MCQVILIPTVSDLAMGASSKEMRSHLNIPINRLLHPRKIVVRVVDMVSWCSLKQTR